MLNYMDFEEHVAETNEFFQLSNCTLDDLDVYAEPLAAVCKAVRSTANGNMTQQELMNAVRAAIRQYKSIDDRICAANAQVA